MEGLDIVALFTTWGWQAVVTALAACFMIGCLKPLVRKIVADEKRRHAIYIVLNAIWVAVFAYAIVVATARSFTIDWAKGFAPAFAAGWAVLNIVYPIYQKLGPQALWEGALKVIKGLFIKKAAEKIEEKKAEVKDDKNTSKGVIEL